MITLTSLPFWAYFLYFNLAIFLTFYIPGNLIIKKLSLTLFQNIVLSIVTGMVMWAWQGFIVGFLNLRELSYVYVLMTFLLWLKSCSIGNISIRIKQLKFLKFDRWLALLILIGTFFQLLTTFFVGLYYKDGIYFCCGLPDSLYHIALTNQIIRQFPPIEPGASEIIVKNYHYWTNLLTADLIRVFRLPLIATQYQYLVLLISLLHGLTAVVFGQLLKINKRFIYWLVFFLYFSGDLTFLLLFILGKGFNFNLPFLENAGWLWISPPRVFASVVFFAGVSLLGIWIKKKSVLSGCLVALLFSSLIGFKIYVGLLVLSGLFFLSVYYFFKRNYFMLVVPMLTVILAVLIYLPVNAKSGGLIFSGLWRFENFIVSPVLGLSHLELARQIYLSHNNWPRLIQYTLMYIGIYFVFVFGTVSLGFLQTKKSLAFLPRELNIFLISGIAISLLIGSFFVQQTGGANSSQFLITVDIIASIYAALFCAYFTKKIRGRFCLLIILLIILLTVPRVVSVGLSNYKMISLRQGFFITNHELEALEFLKKNTNKDSIVLVDNVDKEHWRNAFSYYISFLSDRQILVDGNGIAQDHGIDVEKKIEAAKIIFTSTESAVIAENIKQNKIDYIYMKSENGLKIETTNNLVQEVFNNGFIKVYQTKR